MVCALRGRLAVAVAVAGSLALLTACGSSGATPTSRAGRTVVTEDYLPGLAADVHLPTGVRTAPVVVLIPGGAWLTADRRGLTPLARSLAAAGIVAVNATYRAAGAGGRFPEPVDDVACAVAFAVQRARDAGLTTGPVVVLGHSAGGHVAALAALGADHFAATCPYPRAHIDGLIGLAGTYDVSRLPELAEPFFGRQQVDDPAGWRDGNPMSWVEQQAQRANLTILLAHGTDDADLAPLYVKGLMWQVCRPALSWWLASGP
jgi:acetyl esterase/lipase